MSHFNCVLVCKIHTYIIYIIYFLDVIPQRNRHYQPVADGCGALGMKISTEYLPAVEMEYCCNSHDICYDTCNKDKEICDLDFKRCLYAYCDSHEKSTAGNIVVTGCKAASKMLFTGTLTLGCLAYLDSQKQSCYCPTDQSGNRGGKKKSKYSSDSSDSNYNGNQKQKAPNYGWKTSNEL